MRFSHDRRGQSVVIGTVILFGFLILALSLYQVQVVPQQNAQTEFEQFEEVRNDLVDLRAGILQAGSTDQPQYQTVRLGTSYSTRIFAINPPDPAGTIRTTESYNITIEGSGESVNVSTRFIQYRPGYNEIDQSPTWYDASVLYVDARDEGGGIAVIEDQELVTSDGEVRIVALQNEFRRSGTGRVTLELRPADNVTETLPEGDLTVTVPTRLSEEVWENKTDIPTDSDIYGGVTDDANGDGIYNLTLNTTAENLTLDTVGVGEAPEDATQNDNARVGEGSNTNEESDLPQGFVAYDDANGNGVYDDGTDTPYTADEIGDNNLDNRDIIIERDVTTDKIQQQKLASLVIKEGVTVETTSGKLTFEIDTVGGFIDASGATLIEPNGNQVRLKINRGSGNINVNGASIESAGGVLLELDGDKNGDGSIVASGADITDTAGNKININIRKGSGDITIDGANLESSGGILLKLDGDKNGDGSIVASGADITDTGGNKIELIVNKGSGDIDIEDARLRSDGSITADGKSSKSNTLFANDNGAADGGTYVVRTNGDPADLETKNIDTSGASLEEGNLE